MNIIKLKYESREAGILDLIEKEIILSDLLWDFPTHAVVEVPNKEDEAGYRVDVMIEPPIIQEEPITYKEYFFENEKTPSTPDHSFSGWEVYQEIITPT